MIEKEFPILEFDEEKNAFIRPNSMIQPVDIAEKCVLCFFSEAIEKKSLKNIRIELLPALVQNPLGSLFMNWITKAKKNRINTSRGWCPYSRSSNRGTDCVRL